ncbi:hypothetical protein KAR91_82030 [Candidatus Pacearchaeota archaeon]|nr:hypothetical protein [Candidatus Pacearchaeota archaeon]
MKITINNLSNSRPALNDLGSKPMKASTAHYVSKAIIAVNRALEPFDLTQEKLIEKYKAEVKNGLIIFSGEDDERKFIEELKPVREEEVELEVQKISIKKLGNIQIAPGTFVVLDWLLED